MTLTEADAGREEIVNCAQKKLEGVVVRNVTASGFLIPIKFKATVGGKVLASIPFFLFFSTDQNSQKSQRSFASSPSVSFIHG